jgi:lantibiotic biosynthesis protein
MNDQLCLYTLVRAPRERHEEVLHELVTPVARQVRDSPELDSLFFARYNVPDWEVRFRVLGRPRWVDGPVREMVERRLAPLAAAGTIAGFEFTTYEREIERYGGEEGMALAEKVFLYDTLACLELIEAEGQGGLGKTRREFALVAAEKLLDLFDFDLEHRLAFYAHGYRWAIEMGTWDEADVELLGRRYQELEPGLEDLFWGEQSRDPVLLWGGEGPARIAERWLAETGPVVEKLRAGHAAGRVRQDLVYLAWSYTHMQCNRLGIDPGPEAILRYFMHRLLMERGGGGP